MAAGATPDAGAPAYAGAGMLAALGATLLWGANYTVAKDLLRQVNPLALATARAVAGMLAFGAMALAIDGMASLRPARLRRALPLGLLGVFANQVLFIEGLQRSTPAHSAILIALLPVHVLVLSSFLHRERVSWSKVAGVLIAFVGVVLVATEKGFDLSARYVRGDLLTLCAGLAFAGYTVAGQPVLRELGPLRTTAAAFLGGGLAVVLVGAPAAWRQDWTALNGAALAQLAFVILGATVASYWLYYFAVSRLPPSKVAVFMYLQPVVALLLAYGFGGESITKQMIAGSGLVLAGVVLAERG